MKPRSRILSQHSINSLLVRALPRVLGVKSMICFQFLFVYKGNHEIDEFYSAQHFFQPLELDIESPLCRLPLLKILTSAEVELEGCYPMAPPTRPTARQTIFLLRTVRRKPKSRLVKYTR